MTEQDQPRVKFEQACFHCGSHYCLMDCVKDPEPTTARSWVGLTDQELQDAFYHVDYDRNDDFLKEDPDKWCQEFYKRIDRLLEEKNR
jgi:hypothetical protein